MTRSEAEMLLGRLVAAYPRERLDEANVQLYTERLMRLLEFEAGWRAVDALIDAVPRFPTVAEIRQAYKREQRDRPALPMPPLTEAERQENLRQVRELSQLLLERAGQP